MTNDHAPPAALPEATVTAPEEVPRCECGKRPLPLCLCPELEALPSRVSLLVLQHPQEQDVELGTARLLTVQVKGAVLRAGLSWPNLPKALGRNVDPRRWAVMHMGSKEDVARAPKGGMVLLDRAGEIDPASSLVLADLEGIVLLDGTWSQAKTLWWRNAWLLKLRRLVINPDFRSAYGTIRKEPRRESVSTLEAGAFALARLNHDPKMQGRLTAAFDTLLTRWKAGRASRPPRGGRPASPNRGPNRAPNGAGKEPAAAESAED
jgi:DTW domain-containing protein